MAKRRYEFQAELVAQSPIHVGNGVFSEIGQVKGKESPPAVARLVRNAVGRPYLPSTSLKGAMLQLAQSQMGSKADLGLLFGLVNKSERQLDAQREADPHHPVEPGRMGKLTIFGASRIEPIPSAVDMPYADPTDGTGQLGPGIFVHARTRIDEESGAAADHKLFFQEMAAEGTHFRFRCAVESRDEQEADRLRDHVLTLLAVIAQDGVSLGKGEADGFGVLKLRPKSLAVTVSNLKSDGTFEPKSAVFALPVVSSSRSEEVLELRCDGPFAVMDSSYRPPKKGKGRNAQDKAATNRAQMVNARLPMLLGSSVSGVLRSRARWLWACHLLKHGKDPAMADADESLAIGDELRDGAKDPVAAAIERLSPVGRLFGVTGFKGLLALRVTDVTAERAMPLTSVRIDRFSGAPVENALFTTDTFVGVAFRLSLKIDARRMDLGPDDTSLYEFLRKDIRENGLMLGHGTNKGFGWFRAKEAA